MWKDSENTIHVAVSNDTNTDRKLMIATESGNQIVDVEACPTYNELTPDVTTFNDLPFDIDITIDEDSDFVVCYDVTDGEASADNQIRFVNWSNSPVYRSSNGDHFVQSNLTLVEEGYYDRNIIPDKYNTGCDESVGLTKVTDTMTINGSKVTAHQTSNYLYMNFSVTSANKNDPELIVFENVDFTPLYDDFRILDMGDTKREIRFKNCKIGRILCAGTANEEERVLSFVFENCDIRQASISSATFTNCNFGGSYSDSLNPLYDVTVTNCFFGNYAQSNDEGLHTDAIQIYGADGIIAENILIQNSRIEIPAIAGIADGCINAPLMVQLEYGDADGILIEDCMINGGGYSIYAWDKNKGLTLNDVIFRNLKVGAGYRFGEIYPTVSDGVSFENLTDIEKLYVSSVWKDETGKTHLAVSNDTTTDKVLVVGTDSGTETINIPCMATKVAGGATTTEELPYDIDVVLADSDTDFVVCYDTSVSAENQIRFVNFGVSPVYRTSTGEHITGSGSGNANGTTNIDVEVIPVVVNVTVPLNVTCTINPNEDEGFVYGDIILTNNSKVPTEIRLSAFLAAYPGQVFLTPDGLGTIEEGLTWDALNKEQSNIYYSLGTKPISVGEDEWLRIYAEEPCYAENITDSVLLGVLDSESSGRLGLEAYYGRNFENAKTFHIKMTFVATICDEVLN